MRFNGTFRYKPVVDETTIDTTTGFPIEEASVAFVEGCECQIDISIPARNVVGTDGQKYAYSYDVFIPKYFSGDVVVGSEVQVTFFDGRIETFYCQGIDNTNRKYIELWG